VQSLTTALENLLRHLSQEIPATPGIRVIDIPFPLKDAFDALSWLASQQTYPQFYWQQRNGDEEAAVLGAITRFTSLDQAQRFLRQHPEHADLRIWGLNAFDPSQGNLLLPRLEWRRCGGKATLRLTLFSESSLQHDAIQAKEFIANPYDDENLPEKHKKNIPLLGDCMVTEQHVISVQNDVGTSYQAYINVQNELVAAYNELRDELGKAKFGKAYNECSEDEQKAIREYYQQKISEAEPKKYGGKK